MRSSQKNLLVFLFYCSVSSRNTVSTFSSVGLLICHFKSYKSIEMCWKCRHQCWSLRTTGLNQSQVLILCNRQCKGTISTLLKLIWEHTVTDYIFSLHCEQFYGSKNMFNWQNSTQTPPCIFIFMPLCLTYGTKRSKTTSL